MLNVYECERLVRSLTRSSLREYGGQEWLDQQQALSKLNVQAHLNVQANSEEYITELFLDHDKLDVVVHELILSEVWCDQVLPKLLEQAGDYSLDYTHLYFMLFNQVTCINILEIVLFSKRAVVALGDLSLDLVDYCSRKVALLNSWKDSDYPKISGGKQDASTLLTETELVRFSEQRLQCTFDAAISSLSALRYLTDNVTEIPFSALSRLLTTKDMPSALVALVERAPWIRVVNKEEVYRYASPSRWKRVSRDELEELDKIEAQVWLCLYNLLVEPECRKLYRFSRTNHATVLRLKAYLVDTLKQQLPILDALHRSVEEVQMISPAEDSDTAKHGLIVELLPELYSQILPDPTPAAIADIVRMQLRNSLLNISAASTEKSKANVSRQKMALAASLSKIYDLNQLDVLLEDPRCATCGQPAINRCSKCKSEWYCSRPCQVKSWSRHKQLCEILADSSKAGPSKLVEALQ